jgi:hypothetical protein
VPEAEDWKALLRRIGRDTVRRQRIGRHCLGRIGEKLDWNLTLTSENLRSYMLPCRDIQLMVEMKRFNKRLARTRDKPITL